MQPGVNAGKDSLAIIKEIALALGAFRAEILPVRQIQTDRSFRALCETNACGNYGGNYMCPPNVAPIDELMVRLRTYENALVYQTVSPLEDSFDFEGMMAAGKRHNDLGQRLWDAADSLGMETLHLGAGGCRLCDVCAIRTEEPCRHPKRAMSSLETYGVDVTALAAAAGMRYINGPNTVTYFGAVLI